jgi:adenylate kinase family enzyme
MTPDRSPLLVIVGPTGVGKTAAAVALSQRLPIEVISATRVRSTGAWTSRRASPAHPSARRSCIIS